MVEYVVTKFHHVHMHAFVVEPCCSTHRWNNFNSNQVCETNAMQQEHSSHTRKNFVKQGILLLYLRNTARMTIQLSRG